MRQEFGVKLDGIDYAVRQGAYAVVFNAEATKVMTVRNARGHYFLPGGGIENGESHAECLEREFLEETGRQRSLPDTKTTERRQPAMRADRYQHLFTKELLMGPNAVRLLDEMLERHPIAGGRVLDLGCGTGLTSLFLARETGAEQIFAADLWIPATENWKRIREWGLEDKIIPLHTDARDLPFPDDFFDVVVSLDSYHYYGCEERFFAEKVLPLIRKGGRALILVPGLKREFDGDAPELLVQWLGDEIVKFHDCDWWRKHIAAGCEERIEFEVYETRQFEQPWQDWFDSGHEYGLDDQQFMSRGLDQLINFIVIAVRVR